MTALLTAVLVWGVIAAENTGDAVRWQNAGLYVGQQQWIEGTVVGVRREANVIRLVFDQEPGTFTVALIVGWLSRFPADPEQAYVGKMIRAFGRIRQFHGVPEMLVQDPGRIMVVEAGPTATPLAASAGTSAATPEEPGRLQRLEQRLERMEERIEQLLHPTPR